MKIKINTYVALLFMLLSIFVFGYTIRVATFSNLQYISVFYILGVTIYIYANRKHISRGHFCLLFVYILSTIISDFANHVSMHQWGLYFFMNAIPLFALIIDTDKVKISQKQIYKLVKLYNFFTFLIFAIYLIDLATNSLIMRTLSDNFLTSLSAWVPRGRSLFRSRYASYLGHYLFTDIIYLGFYILNAQYTNSYGQSVIKPRIYNLIGGIGVLSTGSKTGLLMIAILLIIYNANKIKYMISIIAGVIFLYYFGFFNILTNRLATEEFSTGRFDAWNSLKNASVLKIHIFHGWGDNMFSYFTRFVDFGTAGYASEFPFLWILFKVGIVGFFSMILLMLILPVVTSVKHKSFRGTVSIIVFFIAISTFNGVIAYPDVQIVYDIILLLILFMQNTSSVQYKLSNGIIQKDFTI